MITMTDAAKKLEAWKSKAVLRGNENRYLRRENTRLKNARDKYKAEAKEFRKKFKEQEAAAKAPVAGKVDLVFIALQLFCVARIGFRAVSRVLGVLGGYLGLEKTPCPQTIVNWVSRLSMVRIRNVASLLESSAPGNWIWMIDTSIGLGAGKILAVLAVKVDHHHINEGAPSLRDVHCIAVSVAASWTGETIADFLLEAIRTVGCPIAFLKDGGKDLAKAWRILGQRGYAIFSIDDVSHVIANLLKHEYGNHPMFDQFLSECGKTSKRLKQTILACLAPPKVSTKARFMNVHRLVAWADRLLKHSPKGRAKKGSLLEKLRNNLDQLPVCKSFIKRFLRDAAPLLEVQKILKTGGLCNETAKECEALIEVIPPSSPVRIGMMSWMNHQLATAEEIGPAGLRLPITSDSIESLFGVSKAHGTGVVKDANRIATRIPAMCGSITRADAQDVLGVSVDEQKQVMGNLPSLIKQRRDILPNPGALENKLSDVPDRGFELIPGLENRSKKRLERPLKCNYT